MLPQKNYDTKDDLNNKKTTILDWIISIAFLVNAAIAFQHKLYILMVTNIIVSVALIFPKPEKATWFGFILSIITLFSLFYIIASLL